MKCTFEIEEYSWETFYEYYVLCPVRQNTYISKRSLIIYVEILAGFIFTTNVSKLLYRY